MRTCPACGEDTEAGYAETCSECGFSPAGPQQPEESFEVGEVGEVEIPPSPGETLPSPGEKTPSPGETDPSPEEPSKGKRGGPGIGTLIWLVIIGGSLVVDGLGVFDEVSGPDPANVEAQLVLDGSELGATLTADCPDDADQTEVGGSFECVLTTEAGGTATIEVLNNENTYEYRRRDVVALVSRAE